VQPLRGFAKNTRSRPISSSSDYRFAGAVRAQQRMDLLLANFKFDGIKDHPAVGAIGDVLNGE